MDAFQMSESDHKNKDEDPVHFQAYHIAKNITR